MNVHIQVAVEMDMKRLDYRAQKILQIHLRLELVVNQHQTTQPHHTLTTKNVLTGVEIMQIAKSLVTTNTLLAIHVNRQDINVHTLEREFGSCFESGEVSLSDCFVSVLST